MSLLQMTPRRIAGGIAILVALAAVAVTRFRAGSRRGCELPPRDCDGPSSFCGELVWFAPSRGLGYEDVPEPEEMSLPESTSYVRRDLMMLVKYAAAKVACETGGRPLALGDGSERDGATPGTRYGRPRHPAGTHEDGRDIDLGYYQRGMPDNHLRPICAHEIDGAEQWHCIAPPTTLDATRTALFIGALFESPRIRIVGIDGAAAPPLHRALARLCKANRIAPDACARLRLGYELAPTGKHWFLGHHNHMHVSWRD